MTAAKNGSGAPRPGEMARTGGSADGPERRRVYCQSDAIVDGLGKLNAPWQIAPLAQDRNQLDCPAVAIADRNSTLSPQLREAVDGNRARVIFLLDAQRTLPEAASGMPVFAFAAEPIDFSLLGRLIDGAFENLALPDGRRDWN